MVDLSAIRAIDIHTDAEEPSDCRADEATTTYRRQ